MERKKDNNKLLIIILIIPIFNIIISPKLNVDVNGIINIFYSFYLLSSIIKYCDKYKIYCWLNEFRNKLVKKN